MKAFFLLILLTASILSVSFTACVKESKLDLRADTMTIAKVYQPNSTFGKDAIITSLLPNQNFGNENYLAAFAWTNGGSFNSSRALIAFDLTNIPINTKIDSAKLSIFWISYESLEEQTGDNAFSIYRITSDWQENTVNWNKQPSTSLSNVVKVPKSISGKQSYFNIDLTMLVQTTINNPIESHGFMLKLDEEFPYKLVMLASSDNLDSSKLPKLVVYY